MKQFNLNNQNSGTELEINTEPRLVEYPAFVGLDVHKQTISIALARAGREKPISLGEIANKPKTIARMVERLCQEFEGEVLMFCYEAGSCGYVIYRQLVELGQDCQVVAPSEIPKKPGERVKTDRRDALKLARLLRSGDLTPVWVPDQEQEAMRDLTRARNDFKQQERQIKQQLNAYVLRHGHIWSVGKTRWSQAHYNWLEALKFPFDWQQVVLQEYLEAIRAAQKRVADLTAQMERVCQQWSLEPVIDSLVALRGIDRITAIGLMAELGDISRFESPSQLMAYLGLVPGEHSSGSRRRQRAITKTGNKQARRMLVESAWSYRFPARKTAHLKRKAAKASEEAQAIAWKAQKRLCGRYRSLIHNGKNAKQTTVAVARELSGFIWDIVCQEMPKVKVGTQR